MNGIIAIAVETSLLESLPLYSPLVLSCLKSLSCLKFTQQSSLCSSSLLGSSTNPAPVCRLPSLSMHPSCDCFSGGGEKKTGGEVDFSPKPNECTGTRDQDQARLGHFIYQLPYGSSRSCGLAKLDTVHLYKHTNRNS